MRIGLFVANDLVNAIDSRGLEADIIIFDPVGNPADRDLYISSKLIPNDPSAIVLASHGGPSGIGRYVETKGGMAPLVERITALEKYNESIPILSLSCNSASSTGSAYVMNAAQFLSTMLPNPVIGANEEVNISRPGNWAFWAKDRFFGVSPSASWMTYRNGKAVSARTWMIGTSQFGTIGMKSPKNKR